MLSYLREEPIDLPFSVLVYRTRGIRIRNARWRLKLTQQQLGQIIGVSRQTVCVVETTGHMRMQTRRRLEKFLRLDLTLLPEPPVEVEVSEEGGPGATPARLFPSAAPEKV
ncbi:hypothetical protein [Xanthobacter sp. KR7-225]|uniref:helix-turn-helix transcriptional regulator n=1 Tax=Xanthobacter sp. KR7-225 TaxID=3156613 RepID=UPI0032B438F7